MDTSKHFFQLHGVNAAEKVVLRKKLRRKEMVAFFKALAPTVIGIEACGASHHWARILRSFGHEVKLIAPQLVKPYVKRGKNDTADAEALCEAMSRPTMRFVPVKTAEQQAALMMAGLRDRLIRNRTQLSNAIRGYAAEFGFTSARGMAHIDPLLDRIQADESVPVLARELFAAQAEEYAQLQAQIVEADAKLMAWHKADECSRRLAKIPGIGPIGATLLLLKMKTPAPEMFRSGRQFAAWIGLTPKDHSTAGKVRLGVITRAGDEALRSVLVVGATAVIQHVRRGGRGVALDRRPPQAANRREVGRRGVGQQDGPHRLEADGHRQRLCREIRARRLDGRRVEDQPDTGSNSTASRAEPMLELARATSRWRDVNRSKTQDTPCFPLAAKGRLGVWNSHRGNHLGQRSCASAKTGRTYGRKRSDQSTAQITLRGGGRPHMESRYSLCGSVGIATSLLVMSVEAKRLQWAD